MRRAALDAIGGFEHRWGASRDGLLAGEEGLSEHAMRGVGWLVERQNEAGAWDELESTGAGFPNHFYLRYYLYPHYFPLMALGRARKRLLEAAAR